MKKKYIKAINFDLDTAELRKFGMQSKAYSILKREFKLVGYTHRQYSGYLSKEPLSSDDVIEHLLRIIQKYPWIMQCAKRIDVTNIIDNLAFDFKETMSKMLIEKNPFDKGKKAERNPADSTDEEKTQKEDGYKRLADSINKDKAKERLDKIKNKSKSNSDEQIR